MTGTLAPPPRYGREDESILLDSGRQHGGNSQTPKYSAASRGHNRGQSWGTSVTRRQTMQSDISLSSLPTNSPPGYTSPSDDEEAEQQEEGSMNGEESPTVNEATPLVRQ